MDKIKRTSLKIGLALLAGLVILSIVPVTSALAAGENTTPSADYARLEKKWAKELAALQKAEDALSRSGDFINRVQEGINKANQKGWDTAAVQAALNAFKAAIQDARPHINSANGIVTAHKGFDSNGKVTDPVQAKTSIQQLADHLKAARTDMNGTGRALQEAIRAFRDAHPRQPAN